MRIRKKPKGSDINLGEHYSLIDKIKTIISLTLSFFHTIFILLRVM